jgi:hypothetical protein
VLPHLEQKPSNSRRPLDERLPRESGGSDLMWDWFELPESAYLPGDAPSVMSSSGGLQ